MLGDQRAHGQTRLPLELVAPAPELCDVLGVLDRPRLAQEARDRRTVLEGHRPEGHRTLEALTIPQDCGPRDERGQVGEDAFVAVGSTNDEAVPAVA